MNEFGTERARALLEEWTAGESLRKHGLAVAICTEAYGRLEAARLGLAGAEADAFAEPYACAGLLHDMDYERHPRSTSIRMSAWRRCGQWAGRSRCSTPSWPMQTTWVRRGSRIWP